MQSKSIILLALSASAALASPFHKRHDYRHHRLHGSGTFSVQPTASDAGLPEYNETSMAGTQYMTQTVSPLPISSINAGANQVVDSSASTTSCDSTSISTRTSTNLITVTVTASGTDAASTQILDVSSVSAGAFYAGGRSWTRSNGGQSTASAIAVSVSSAPAVSAANPSTTFATVSSASKSSVAASSAVVSSAPVSGSSGGKRGISFNDASLVAAFGDAVSWSYNWGASESGSLGDVEFVPMMWGTNNVDSFASSVGSATHVLSFNEPDLAAQSNIDPVTAAKLHKQGMSSLVGKVQIGSPAVTNGAGTSPVMGVDWLDQFFTACGGDCSVDFVAYHWYATADSIDYFKQHTQDIIDVAKKYGVSKVWLTEFEPSGTADAQAAFMKEAVAFLDATAAVERYAAFMASEGTMLSGGSLNTVGSAYAAAS